MIPDCEDGVGALTGAAAALSEGVDDADDGGAGDGTTGETVDCAVAVTGSEADSVVVVAVVDMGKEVLVTDAGTGTVGVGEAEEPAVGVVIAAETGVAAAAWFCWFALPGALAAADAHEEAGVAASIIIDTAQITQKPETVSDLAPFFSGIFSLTLDGITAVAGLAGALGLPSFLEGAALAASGSEVLRIGFPDTIVAIAAIGLVDVDDFFLGFSRYIIVYE